MKELIDLAKLKDSPKSYPEDFNLENGNYVCTCYLCKDPFIGYKRRVICKQCNQPENKKESNNE